jgi:hypothetical protein
MGAHRKLRAIDQTFDAVIDGLNIDDEETAVEAWREWVREYFPVFAFYEFGDHHVEFWEWIWSIEPEKRPKPFVAIWPRGGAKSSSAEMACVALGARKIRSYIWYCCETQDQADTHVGTIAEILEGNKAIERDFPLLARRDVGKFGNPRGWRRNRLRAGNGLIVDAIGLDTARRGSKVMEKRPDFIIFDDIDGKHDTEKTTQKKIDRITTSLLPAGSRHAGTLMVQNLIHDKSVFAQLADGTAEFLYNRHVSGPYPAIDGLAYEQTDTGFKVTAGAAIWEGQSVEIAEEQINDWGLSAFMSESQHDVEAKPGGIWDHYEFRHVNRSDVPDLVRGAVWVDPAVTDKDQSDSHAIQADGIDPDGIIYRFYSWERQTSPNDSIWRAILISFQFGFRTVGIETDQGGDTWKSVYREVWREMMESVAALIAIDAAIKKVKENQRSRKARAELKAARDALEKLDEIKVGRIRPYAKRLHSGKILRPKFKQAKAGSGHGSKVERNERMLADYERGRVVHVVGTHVVLEKSLKRFPLTKPLDLADASFWSWADLRGVSKGAYF